MGAHARKSASGSKRWIGCPGSLALCDSIPEHLKRPTSEAALTGTCAHALGEMALNFGWRELPEAIADGQVMIFLDQDEDATIVDNADPELTTPSHVSAAFGKDVKFVCRVDDKMAEGVQLYLDTVWTDRDEMGRDTEMYVERRFDLTWLRPDMFGTSDCTLYEFMGLLRVIDYKNGYVPVEVEGNTQGLYYGLGMAHEVDWLFEDLEVVIVQPNSQAGGGVRRYRISKDELKAFEKLLGEAADKADAALEAFNLCTDEAEFLEWAGEWLSAGKDGSHCQFCDALPTCPMAKWAAEAVAQDDFANIPPEENPMAIDDDRALDRLQQVLTWGPFLDNLVSAAKELGQRRLEQGLEVPGYKLVLGKANRKWVGEDEVIEALTGAGFPKEELFEEPKPPALKSPAQMEKLGEPRSKERAKAKKLIETLAIKPPGKVAMAPLSDPREAVAIGTASDDFAGVDE